MAITQNRPSPSRLLRLPEVLERLNVSRSSFYEGVRIGLFPAPVRVGKRTACWRDRDIDAYIENLK